MEFADLQERLNAAVERYDSQTFLGSYRETTRSSLLKEGLSTRANSLWKMAQIVVAKKDDGSPDGASSGYLTGWRTLASNYNNQTLLLEVAEEKWEMYDAQGVKQGEEEYIKEYLKKMSLKKQVKQPGQDSSDVFQRITYGAPGTGKSFSTDRETKGKATFRTTFHPDTDYSNFVGSYKPTKEVDPFETVVNVGKYKDGKISKEEELIRKSEISYDFVPQAFIRAYVAAWKKYAARVAAGGSLTEDDQVYLVIEEINRGHCAQIFGDLFQLLDRNEEGFSDYPIDADVDLAKWLHAQFAADDFGDDFKAIKGYEEDGKLVLKLCLPPNLFIRATMNTSDQSLFPMDSAFKRRWDWRYVPISEPDKDDEPDFNKRKVLCKLGGENKVERRFDWWEFLKVINAAILNATKSEDKQLGYFFVKVPNNPGEISAEKFAGKVLFYLYNDVFKDYNYPDAVFAKKNQPAGGPKVKYSFKEFFDAKGQAKDAMVAEFLENLGIPSEDKQLPA